MWECKMQKSFQKGEVRVTPWALAAERVSWSVLTAYWAKPPVNCPLSKILKLLSPSLHHTLKNSSHRKKSNGQDQVLSAYVWNYVMYGHNPKTPQRPEIHISIISQILGIHFCYLLKTLKTCNKLLVKEKLNNRLWIYIAMYGVIKSCFWPLSSPRVTVEGWPIMFQPSHDSPKCHFHL